MCWAKFKDLLFHGQGHREQPIITYTDFLCPLCISWSDSQTMFNLNETTCRAKISDTYFKVKVMAWCKRSHTQNCIYNSVYVAFYIVPWPWPGSRCLKSKLHFSWIPGPILRIFCTHFQLNERMCRVKLMIASLLGQGHIGMSKVTCTDFAITYLINMDESYQNYSRIQDYEALLSVGQADFPQKILK